MSLIRFCYIFECFANLGIVFSASVLQKKQVGCIHLFPLFSIRNFYQIQFSFARFSSNLPRLYFFSLQNISSVRKKRIPEQLAPRDNELATKRKFGNRKELFRFKCQQFENGSSRQCNHPDNDSYSSWKSYGTYRNFSPKKPSQRASGKHVHRQSRCCGPLRCSITVSLFRCDDSTSSMGLWRGVMSVQWRHLYDCGCSFHPDNGGYQL